MVYSRKNIFLFIASASAIAIAIPAIGQESPESLIPEGFDDPPAPAPTQPAPVPPTTSMPSTSSPTPSTPSSAPRSGGSSSRGASAPSTNGSDEGDALEDEIPIRYDVPPALRRSMKRIGVITPKTGGFPADAYGDIDGKILVSVIKKTQGPLVSRWANIFTRRLLASSTNSPDGVKPQDWVAERAWFLLRMGESITARQLVQQIDAGNYTKRLYTVTMQALLANADLAGMCPHADRANIVVKDDPTWKMARPICASLAAEQASATVLLRQNRRKKTMVGVDYLLTEKAVGAGTGGRRSVKIEWDKAKGFNAWRHGLANATGVIPPKRYYAESGIHLAGWNALLPMLPLNSRIKASYDAAALGVLSSDAMSNLFAQAIDDPDVNDKAREQAGMLAGAFAAGNDASRVGSMRALWGDAPKGRQGHAMLVLTARAAAAVSPSSDLSGDSDNLIRSMMTAGFDRSAARWIDVVSEGSLGWGLLVVGSPGMEGQISYGQLDSFYDDDESAESIKSKMLLAGLAGLGRVGSEAQDDFAERLEFDLGAQSVWTRAISAAASRGESGTVMLLAAAGLQGRSWSRIPPRYLYHIVRALKETGREAEARMIAAEAVSFA
ncbi:MAG: hypothetical protein V3V15_04955 [Sphingorhabdus sp.]